MLNEYIIKTILPELIQVLKIYNLSGYAFRAVLDPLYRAKHSNASTLQKQLQDFLKPGADASVFNDVNSAFDTNALVVPERAVSRQSDLTMPSRGEQASDWTATPKINTLAFCTVSVTNNDEDWPPPTPIITGGDTISDEADTIALLNAIFYRERKKIKVLRNGFRSGSLDGILYAMSRAIYFTRWFHNEVIPNLPVVGPEDKVEGLDTNQKCCLQLIWLIANYMCKYSYDRACKRWDHYHINKINDKNYYPLEIKYYLESGVFNMHKQINKELMEELDIYGNTMVNGLYLLSISCLEEDKSKQHNLLVYVTQQMLNPDKMPIEHMNQNYIQQLKNLREQLINTSKIETVAVIDTDVPVMQLFDSSYDEDIIINEETQKPARIIVDSSTSSNISRSSKSLTI